MIRTERRWILIMAAGMLVGCFADAGIEVSGHIRDLKARPLEGVHVVIDGPAGASASADRKTIDDAISLADGCFDASSTHLAVHGLRLRVTKTGYKPYVIDLRSGIYTNDVVLAPVGAVGVSSGELKPHDPNLYGRAPCQR
jgi:hypothetical protein